MNPCSNVLLIEDNPGDARLVAAYLDEGSGGDCEVRQVRTLADGLSHLLRNPVDLVLLDLGLPDSQGLDAFHQVRRLSPRTPVVILTGDDNEDQALHAVRVGAEDYLSKQSVDSVTLLRAMRHAVQRRELSDHLLDSEARFRAIVETAEEGILQLNREGAVLYLNARAAQWLGLPPTAPPTASPAAPQLDPQQLRQCVQAPDWPAFDGLLRTAAGERNSCELQLQGPGGRPLWVIAAAGGIAARQGSPSAVVLLLTDITGLKLADEALQHLKRALESRVHERTALLEAANTELRAIGHAMAHDLRNPLNGIIGMAQLIGIEAQHLLPTTAWQRLQLVQQSALEMNALIAKLLALATLGQQALQADRLDLSAMVQAIAQRMSAAEPGRAISWQIQPEVGALGDRVLIANLLQNLLDNACKYTSTLAAAVIEFGCRQQDGSGPVYFVHDNGIGFDMAKAGQLFQAFARMPSASGHAGTGLGLASAKRIVERHGGKLWVDSAPGAGATLSFTLHPSVTEA